MYLLPKEMITSRATTSIGYLHGNKKLCNLWMRCLGWLVYDLMKLGLMVIITQHVLIACLFDTFFWLYKGSLCIQCIRLPSLWYSHASLYSFSLYYIACHCHCFHCYYNNKGHHTSLIGLEQNYIFSRVSIVDLNDSVKVHKRGI